MVACMQLFMLFTTILLLMQPIKTTSKVPAVIVFGDSTVDTGNNNYIPTIVRSNFLPYGRDFFNGTPTGRFSNGRIPPDFISEGFGLRPFVPAYLDPDYQISDFASGVCFASAGTGYDTATSDILNVIPLWREVEYYKEYQANLRAHLGKAKANKILSEALYVVSIGTNDFLENYYAIPRRRIEFTIDQFQDFILRLAEKFLRKIYALGVRKVSLTSLPPMGCLPLERATNFLRHHDCIWEYNKVGLEFNKKMNRTVVKLNQELPGMKIFFANIYDILMDMINHPWSYGFDSVRVGCCATGTYEMGFFCRNSLFTCINADRFLFWDAIHPTEKTSRILSNYVLKSLKKEFK